MDNRDLETKEEGSIWASYSDMFTTLAIVFLVMFVFAMIKLGVTSIEKVVQQKNHEEKMKGDTPVQEQKRVDELKNKVTNQVKQVEQYQDLLTGKVSQIQNFIKDLDENRKTMDELLKVQTEKEVAITNLKSKIDEYKVEKETGLKTIANLKSDLSEKESLLQSEMATTQKLESEIASKVEKITLLDSKNVRLLEEQKRLESEIAQQVTQIQLKDNNLNQFELKNEELTKVLDSKNQNLAAIKDQLAVSQQHIKELDQSVKASEHLLNDKKMEAEKLGTKISQMQEKINQQTERGNGLENQLKTLAAEKAQLESNFNAGQSEFAQLKGQNAELESKLSKMTGQYGTLQGKYKESMAQVQGLQAQNGELQSHVNGLEGKLSKAGEKIGALEGELKETQALLAGVNNQLADSQAELRTCQDDKNLLAGNLENTKTRLNTVAVAVNDEKKNMRTQIAKKLAEKFKALDMNVSVDGQTGNVTILMGSNFLFQKNSARLSPGAKKFLTNFIPTYAQVLMADENIRGKIAAFNVEGHASPSFEGRYVDPQNPKSKGYSYNLELSSRRAASLADYIFGTGSKNYEFKKELRAIGRAIGHGYLHPIAHKEKKQDQELGRSLASTQVDSVQECGPYDCLSSQRVELSFSLKDDSDVVGKLMELQRGSKK
jgi:chromosome segregation ATPase